MLWVHARNAALAACMGYYTRGELQSHFHFRPAENPHKERWRESSGEASWRPTHNAPPRVYDMISVFRFCPHHLAVLVFAENVIIMRLASWAGRARVLLVSGCFYSRHAISGRLFFQRRRRPRQGRRRPIVITELMWIPLIHSTPPLSPSCQNFSSSFRMRDQSRLQYLGGTSL